MSYSFSMKFIILFLLRVGEAEHKLKKNLMFARMKQLQEKNTPVGISFFVCF